MVLADELLSQSLMLATVDAGVPAQANLRRAISSAYYALFHVLISEAVTLLVPDQPASLRAQVSRAFNHAEMKKVCSSLFKNASSSEFKDRYGAALFSGGISDQLRIVAESFSALQEARHSADYDVAQFFSRSDSLHLVQRAQRAFAAWHSVRDTDEANVFLTALAFGARWSK